MTYFLTLYSPVITEVIQVVMCVSQFIFSAIPHNRDIFIGGNYNMDEVWKPVKGYEGLYEVSNMGRVKSLERTVWDNRGCYRTVPEKILRGRKNNCDYLQVHLYRDGKAKWHSIHRLVAQAFLENPQNLPEVNHIDEVRDNNIASNLEWCSRLYNIEYSQGKAVIGINKVSGLILEFPSSCEASRVTGINQSHITQCCKGRLNSAGGFLWFYAE